jgi:hypothetical protein
MDCCHNGCVPGLPEYHRQATQLRGGNTMGLGDNDGHRFIIEINCLWRSKADDDTIYKMSKQLTDDIEKQLSSNKAASDPGISAYNPLFMNDATYDQDVLASYKDSDKFRQLQKSIDPEGFFAKRAGSFKY